MKRPAIRIWPTSLAGRLVLLLVGALAVAQFALVFALRGQQDTIVDRMARARALGQTVALARLLTLYPLDDQDRLADAFGSRQSCAVISSEPPAARTMSGDEQRLANLIGVMLQGFDAGAPQATMEPIAHRRYPCEGAGPYDGAWTKNGSRWRNESWDGGLPRLASVALTIPLPDRRWLTMRVTADAPGGWDGITLISFLLSSLAVGVVAILAVRFQTRSLRALADVSERFGRGEAVGPLATTGPSEVVAAIRAFNTMQERLSLFIRDRLRLLAGISHDLRTPLTTLRLKAEFVDDEGVRNGIVATVDELTAICEATLAFTRAEAMTEATESADLGALVGEVAEAFHLAGENVVVTRNPRLCCPCRPVALKRAVRNLIENAVRYGGGARVSVAEDEGSAMIAIEDDGPGLPPDQIEDAFQPFVRLDASRSTETGGIGLGLAIARSVARAHGGTVSLANRTEGGLRAEIRLPLKPDQSDQPTFRRREAAGARSGTEEFA